MAYKTKQYIKKNMHKDGKHLQIIKTAYVGRKMLHMDLNELQASHINNWTTGRKRLTRRK